MKEYKYFYIQDKTKEAVGKIIAENELEATAIAARKKDLSIKEFQKIFKLEEL